MLKTAKEWAIPFEVSRITSGLQKAEFEAYLVGGCVRDIILGLKPRDWDVATNAKPEEIISLFEHTFYDNAFGTVGIVNENPSDPSLEVIEATTYRLESGYSDSRRPDKVSFSQNLEDDLKRRDFTINSMALGIPAEGKTAKEDNLKDPFGGLKDIEKGVIRCVGEPNERFSEDALRMLRAIRLFAELGFAISAETAEAIEKNSKLLGKIAKERTRDEFVRIVMSERPLEALNLAQKLGILRFIIPELERGLGVEQNQAHAFDVWEHSLRTLAHAAKKKMSLEVRLAALLHDIGKPISRRKGENGEWTFYGHDVVGTKMAKKIMSDLKFPKDTAEKVVRLVRNHMFFSDTEQITLSAVRRLIARVGQENVWPLMDLRACDRIGTGRPKESPYRLRKYHSMIEEAMRDPVSVKMLKINGNKIMEITEEESGPRIGWITHALLEEVLDDPTKNTGEYLENKARELSKMKNGELKKLGEAGKEKKEGVEMGEIKKIRGRHWVE